MAKRAKPGDVLAVSTLDGVIYLQYLGRHAEYGDGVAVCPRIIQTPGAAITPELFRDAYVTFYPAAAGVRRELADVVGHLPSPGLPRRWRRPGARVGLKIVTWILEDSCGEELKRQLSEEERHLPIAAIWNHELLIQRVVEGWRPEMEDGGGSAHL